MHDPGRARSVDEALHRADCLLRATDIELPVRKHEVDLGVDVPKDGHVTSSSRRLGLYVRPTFADGRPSASTISAVKSFEPRISDEPTPYASTGTPCSSNSMIFSIVKPPEATIFTCSKPSLSSVSRTLRTSRSLTPVGLKSPNSSHSERSTSISDVSRRTPHNLGPSVRATSSAVCTELFSKSTSTVMLMSSDAHSANFVAASTVLHPYDAISECGTVPIPRPPHQDACSSVVTPIGAPTTRPATYAAYPSPVCTR